MQSIDASIRGWSIEISHWEDLRDIWPSDWERIPLDANYRHRISSDANGLYLICAGLTSINLCPEIQPSLYTILYVGQGNLRSRFQQHCNAPHNERISKAKLTYKKLDFWFCSAVNVNLRMLEQCCITAFGPPANKINSIKARLGNPIKL